MTFRKYISKKFIRELSSVITCNVCFEFLKDPIECSRCQNIWCKQCIDNNYQRCPCKCEHASFVKPHRLIRQFMEEIVLECEKCQFKMPFCEYQDHFENQQCIVQQKHNSIEQQLKLDQREVKQKKKCKITRCNLEGNMISEVDYDDINHISDDDYTKSYTKEGVRNQNELCSDVSTLFRDYDQDILEYGNQELKGCNRKKEKIKRKIIKCKKQTQGYEQQHKENNNQLLMNHNGVIREFQQEIQIKDNELKKMEVYVFGKNNWERVDEQLNIDFNLKIVEHLLKNEGSLEDLKLKVKNTVFDLGTFEMHESFQSIQIRDDNDMERVSLEGYGLVKRITQNKRRFTVFNSLEQLLKHVRVYVNIESDKVFYSQFDREVILKQFLQQPTSIMPISTQRAQLDMSQMTEFNGSKIRPFKFLLNLS